MTFTPRFQTLNAIFERSVHTFPDNPLFGTKANGTWSWMTYRTFGEQVALLRGGLTSLGIEKGDRVAIISDNRPEWAMGAYAAYGIGAQFVPMYEAQLTKEWVFILDNCGAKLVFAANASIAERLEGVRDQLPGLEHIVVLDPSDAALTFAEVVQKGAENPTPIADLGPDDIAGFIYTSGTTGNPKGVLLSHGNLAHNVSAIHEVFPIEAEDRSLSFLPWAHAFGQTAELHVLFSKGASLGIVEAIPKIVDNLSEVKPTFLVSVPRIFNRIYDGVQKKMAAEGGIKKRLFDAAVSNAQARRKLAANGQSSFWVDTKHKVLDKLVFSKVRERFGGNLRFAISGGAALNKQVAEFIDDLGIDVYEGYGLTETSPIVSTNWPGQRRIGSIGQPIPGIRVVVDTEVTDDPEQGELVVYGHNVMRGYYGLPEAQAEVFTEDGGFRTGDMGRIDADGFIWITGRIKEQYKLENGKYVVPSPLEEQLKLSPFILNILLYGHNRPFNVALIVPDFEVAAAWAAEQGISDTSPEALCANDAVLEKIHAETQTFGAASKHYELPKRIRLLTEEFTTDNGMLTPSLKLKRRVVLARYGEEVEALYA